MSLPRRWRRPTGTWVGVAVLALLAYVPSLSAGRGRMPADTKLYLYLDPGRLVSDAPYTFDGRQFAGWVPHQTISYLWPSGPWYWTFDQLGVPDWVAHRLWIGTILLVAGLGVRWVSGLLGIGGAAAVAAAAVYQLSPYVLPYLSRTSLMLLPYAALGWIVGLTVLAATRHSWRHAALLALVVATVAAPNATAIAMVAPAPVLWLLHAAWGGEITWRRAVVTAGRIAGLCVAVSLWWLAMLAVQGRYGADVLAYSETLEAVSLTSTSTETLRAMGYWLFYVRDPVGFTTSAAEAYMASGRLVVTSFLVTGVGLAGLAAVRFRARRFAVLLVVVGTVLAVGVHPIDDPSPLMAPLADSSRSTFVLALRSSTRALPMSVLGTALGAGALVAATSRILAARRRARADAGVVGVAATWPRVVPAATVVVLAAVNLPAAWNGGFVDPVLERDQDPPAAWTEAAAALDAAPAGSRVLQVPGAEFGAFTWGYTVDPPLPGLTERPLVTRDLLPLGSPAAMDLVYALDDRFQEGVVEGGSIAPVARLLGADTIWVPNDAWFDRFRTPRPEVTAELFASEPDGLGRPRAFGEPFVPEAVIESIDERALGDPVVGTPLEPVWLVPVEDPTPVIRAKRDVVALAGSGDGIVDAAAAGVLDGSELVAYTAALPDDADPARLVVTDSNRDQARQWRGSQDTRGFTEDGAPGPGVLERDSADQRLAVFPDATGAEHHTVAVQEGPVTAAASAYGEPFAYRPEDRAAMAVDGDLATAWRVADRAPAVGQHLELTTAEPVAEVTLVQPALGATGLPVNRWITAIDVSVDGGAPVRVALDERSRTVDGQPVALATPGTTVRLTVAATQDALPERTGPDAVGFAEVRTALGPSTEVVRPPTDWTDLVDDGTPVDVVLTRLRTAPTNRWRSDPEPALVREVDLPDAATLEVTVRLSPRADDRVIAELLGHAGATADARVTGVPAAGGWAATDGDPDTAWMTPFGRPTGVTLGVPVTSPTVDELRLRQPAGEHSTVTRLTATGAAGATASVDVPAPDAGGWSSVDLGGLAVDGVLSITIDAVDQRTTVDRRSAEVVALPAAIAEIDVDGVAVDAPLPSAARIGCIGGLLTLDGADVPLDLGTLDVAALLDGEAVTVEPCDDDVVAAGTHRIASTPGRVTALDVDRVVARTTGARSSAPGAAPEVRVLEHGRTHRTVEVDACPTGCWIVLGEGLNPAWSASLDGDDLGTAALVDGGFHGWWLPPSDAARQVRFEWGAQRAVTVGLALSGVAVAGCVVLAIVGRGRRRVPPPRAPRFARWSPEPDVRPWAAAVVTAAVALLVVGPLAGVAGLAVGAVAGWLRRPRLLAGLAFTMWGAIGAIVLWRVVRYRPFPSASWPGTFEDLHRPGMFVLALLAGSLVAADAPRRPRDHPPTAALTSTDSISTS